MSPRNRAPGHIWPWKKRSWKRRIKRVASESGKKKLGASTVLKIMRLFLKRRDGVLCVSHAAEKRQRKLSMKKKERVRH